VEATLLVELLTEELPPKSLCKLADTFANVVVENIIRHRFKTHDPKKRTFATPRRIAVLISDVLDKGSDSHHEKDGPLASNQKAVEGFAKKHGLSPSSLERRHSEKGEIVVARYTMPGVQLDTVLARIVQEAIEKLPVAKLMRWGEGEAQFVRPVHGLVMMHGSRVVPGSVLGLASGNRTRGHRFMGKGELVLKSADEYEARLRDQGKVIADFAARRAEIARRLAQAAEAEGAQIAEDEALLDEVTALVEYPEVYAGRFEDAYLEVPQECLILTMRQNQKYFPLFDAGGRLLPKFLIVSNMRAADPRHIVAGNERVVRPRLADARFFYDRDRRRRLEERVPELARVVYHAKLGSQLERVERIQLLAGRIAAMLGADKLLAERAAWLCKADLLTGMVGEFPELQGVMGRYYALHDGEPREVADAIEAHYRPRHAGDMLPEGTLACALALAERLDALAGLFGIGQQPTGDKDPFGLRRAALGVVRILVERGLALDLHPLADAAVREFIYERFAGYLKEQGYSTLQVEAVLSKEPGRLDLVPRQLEAVKAFQRLPEAESLASANKRVANILRQAAGRGEAFDRVERGTLKEDAEIALFEALEATARRADRCLDRGDYSGFLASFAEIKVPVDNFFDKVMVMTDEAALRANRLALLAALREAMNRVADIAKLAQ